MDENINYIDRKVNRHDHDLDDLYIKNGDLEDRVKQLETKTFHNSISGIIIGLAVLFILLG